MKEKILDMRVEPKDIQGILDLCKEFPNDSVMAEIGAYSGESTLLFLNSGKIQKLYAIDPWIPGYDDNDNASDSDFDLVEQTFDKNIKGHNVIKMKCTFAEAFHLLPELDIIYIDGNHTYEAVKQDIELSLHKIKKSGIICGHDYHGYALDTVVKAVDETLGSPEKIFIDSSWMIKIK
jgi:predicted O-methyltransferase YrrM